MSARGIIERLRRIRANVPGEMGAGFAVVAGEVGKLSEKSSAVNADIEGIVTKIAGAVDEMKKEI